MSDDRTMDDILDAVDDAIAARMNSRNARALEDIYAFLGANTEWDPTSPEELQEVIGELVRRAARPAKSPFTGFGAAAGLAGVGGGGGGNSGGFGGNASGSGAKWDVTGIAPVRVVAGDTFHGTMTYTVADS